MRGIYGIAAVVVTAMLAFIVSYALRETPADSVPADPVAVESTPADSVFGGRENAAIVAQASRLEAYRLGALPESLDW